MDIASLINQSPLVELLDIEVTAAADREAVISLSGDVAPTVDMRIDYLAPVTTDLTAEAEVVREGSSLSTVRVEIRDTEGARVATARGTYKTDGQGGETPWVDRSNLP